MRGSPHVLILRKPYTTKIIASQLADVYNSRV